MVNSIQDKSALGISEEKTMENSNLAPDESEQKAINEQVEEGITLSDKSEQKAIDEQEEKATTLSELPDNIIGDFLNGEKIADEEKQSQSSPVSDGLTMVEYRGQDVTPDQQSTPMLNSGSHFLPCNKQNSPVSDGLTMVEYCGQDVTPDQQSTPMLNSGSHLLPCNKQNSPVSDGFTMAEYRGQDVTPDQQSTPMLNSGSHFLPCNKQIKTPSIDDGYNWRKYGQKFVKGNEFVRSYYRCTYPSCRAKRQVERAQDWRITDTVYIGTHTHVDPQHGSQESFCNESPMQSIRTEGNLIVLEEDKSLDAYDPAPTSHVAAPMASPKVPPITPTKNVLGGSHSQSVQPKLNRDVISHVDEPPSKLQKINACHVDETPGEKLCSEPRFVCEPRVVVETMSIIDVLQDGYRWRKYGQKMVKGNPNPRSYYRCSNSGCPAKKHVERAPHDTTAVITTYEGQHDHDMPPVRTVTPNRGGPIAYMRPGPE